MLIKCYGARGSIAVSGKDFLKYGGDTTCIYIKTKSNDSIIIDAGTGIRNLGKDLLKRKVKDLNIFFTHPHWDHISGFPFFKPLYTDGTNINIWGPKNTQAPIKKIISHTMSAPYFPVDLKDLHAKITFKNVNHKCKIGSVDVSTVPLNHTNAGYGYKFTEKGKTFVFITDNELMFHHKGGSSYEEFVDFCMEADLLVHDAEFNDRDYRVTKGWGHSRYKDALKLALDANVKTFGLFHHNQDRTDKQVDLFLKDCKAIAKKKKSKVKCIAISDTTEIKL